MPEVFLVGGVRTPQGKYGGGLAGVRPDDLAAQVVRAAVERGGVPADAIGWPCCSPGCPTARRASP
jgi:acetyl-CoA acetyltransferase